VAISPPQGGESVAPPLLFGVSASRANQWPSGDIVNVSADAGEFNRAANWLIGKPDNVIEQLLAEGAISTNSISSLRRIARAADRIEDLRHHPDALSAIDALRTLCSIAPGAAAAKSQKRESLVVIEQTLSAAPLQAILSLANFKEQDYPSSEILGESVHSWTLAHLPMLESSDALQLIEAVAGNEGEKWWLDAIQGAIAAGMTLREEHWYRLVFRYLCHSINLAPFPELRSHGSDVETHVLRIAEQVICLSEQFPILLQNSTALQWSKLHAWALYKSLPAGNALARQISFKPAYMPGLQLLVERIPATQLVAAALASGDDRILESVSMRTTQEPSLMRELDLSSASWRTLWSFHVVAGGDPWPAGVDRTKEMEKFLVSALHTRPRDGVIQLWSADFATVAVSLPDRTRLWSALNSNDARALADHTAVLLLNEIELGADIGAPETYLRDAVVNLLAKSSLSARAATMTLSWEPNLSEYNALSQVNHIRDWTKGARELGKLIHSRRWSSIASDLYGRYVRGETGLSAALNECKDDLSFWERWRFCTSSNGGVHPPSMHLLIERVAELGGDLEPDRLDYVLQRAGGMKKQLLSQGTAAQRWNEAARCAAQGGLNGGLKALVDVLADGLPFNSDLRELRVTLSSFKGGAAKDR